MYACPAGAGKLQEVFVFESSWAKERPFSGNICDADALAGGLISLRRLCP
jgi:hypothetical protein